MTWRRPHQDDRLFLTADRLAEDRMPKHRVFWLSDPAILALCLVAIATVGGLVRWC